MILIDESQRDLLRIAWKDKIDSPVNIFRLTTVTYGTKSAPYLATRSLKQLAIDDDALESINCLDIPRYCLQEKSIRTELHGFSDSSEKAYGAALYLRCINTSGEISVRFLCSKSKVAPLKSITIPRLELCGAVLLSRLLKRALDAFKVNISQIYLWTDSSTVLAWIKKPLAQLKTFVRNRVSIIQELTESDFWKHVNSENNPTDILSRGISPDKIQHCELWWFGPPSLHQYKELEPYELLT
ncbi:uncharacterized protein TNCV_4494551 [Trichonephila clavipes]|nr:uncharacterized protein TNCV_4494551 [Trichonephila clavipes]